MKFLVSMYTDVQENDAAVKLHLDSCRQQEEMGLLTTHLYHEAVKMNSEYEKSIRAATLKGTVIGATAACLIGVGVLGYNKFSNYRKLKKINKEEEA